MEHKRRTKTKENKPVNSYQLSAIFFPSLSSVSFRVFSGYYISLICEYLRYLRLLFLKKQTHFQNQQNHDKSFMQNMFSVGTAHPTQEKQTQFKPNFIKELCGKKISCKSCLSDVTSVKAD